MARDFSIAILLPTHKRTDALSRSVLSLINLANKINDIQFVFGIDNNDDIGRSHFVDVLQPELDKRSINYTALEFEPLGYLGLNQYFNTLAKNANADWLFVWCDDAIMETQGWDDRIRECTGEFKLLKTHTHNEHPYSIFPIIPAEWHELNGYLSRHQLVDAEVSQIAYLLDIMKIIDVNVTHDRADLTGNNADENAAKKKYLEGNPSDPRDFHHHYFTKHRDFDCERLSIYMKSQDIDNSYWENIKAGTQDAWERLYENDPNGQVSRYDFKQDVTGKIIMVKQKHEQ